MTIKPTVMRPSRATVKKERTKKKKKRREERRSLGNYRVEETFLGKMMSASFVLWQILIKSKISVQYTQPRRQKEERRKCEFFCRLSSPSEVGGEETGLKERRPRHALSDLSGRFLHLMNYQIIRLAIKIEIRENNQSCCVAHIISAISLKKSTSYIGNKITVSKLIIIIIIKYLFF